MKVHAHIHVVGYTLQNLKPTVDVHGHMEVAIAFKYDTYIIVNR